MLLRKIRQTRWITSEHFEWLTKDDIQADPLGDLQTTNNDLSLWLVDNPEEDLDQVLTAIASTNQHLSHVDYLLFDEEAITELELDLKETDGGTPYESVNDWHRDITNLSGSQILKLAKTMLAGGEVDRQFEKRMTKLILEAIASGAIAFADLNKDLRKNLQPLVS